MISILMQMSTQNRIDTLHIYVFPKHAFFSSHLVIIHSVGLIYTYQTLTMYKYERNDDNDDIYDDQSHSFITIYIVLHLCIQSALSFDISCREFLSLSLFLSFYSNLLTTTTNTLFHSLISCKQQNTHKLTRLSKKERKTLPFVCSCS